MTTTASDMITFWPKIGNYNAPGSDNALGVLTKGTGAGARRYENGWLTFIVAVRNWVAAIYATVVSQYLE